MLRQALIAALLLTLAACKDPGSAVNEPAPSGPGVKGAPELSLGEAAKLQGATLRTVRNRHRLTCGVNTGLIGFAFTDNRGQWRGFDIDFCRATAAAVMNDPNAVRYVPLGSTERFTALQSGEVDVLWRNTSWTYSRDTGNRLDFAGINYFDGQGFLVRKSLGLHSATELNGARICVQTGSTTELNVADFFRSKGLKYTPVVVDTEDQAHAAYAKEACDALTADMSELAAVRTILDNPDSHMLLPEVISKEPFGPVVRQGDAQWEDIIRWTLDATILAEEFGITSKNIDEIRKTTRNPEIRRLLGVDPGYGKMLGLSDDWAYRAIKTSGNYGEIFERNIGRGSPLKLERGMNALWSAPKPGLLYAPPMR
jgi:general L-amino acid transport system substrate-binding protein